MALVRVRTITRFKTHLRIGCMRCDEPYKEEKYILTMQDGPHKDISIVICEDCFNIIKDNYSMEVSVN